MRARLLAAFITSLISHSLLAQTTPSVTNGGAPYVSPDGKRLAFWSNRDGQSDLYTIGEDGTGLVRLTQTPEFESLSNWTRDGKQVVFTTGRDTARVQSVSAMGGDIRQLGQVVGYGIRLAADEQHLFYSAGHFPYVRITRSDLNGRNLRQLSDEHSGAINLAVSPDGMSIAYARIDSARMVQVWVINVDGSNARAVTSIDTTEGRPTWPSWSPDNRMIAIQVEKYGRPDHSQDVAHIWTIDVATHATRKLAAHAQPYLDETPAWFPDGKRIAFQSNRTGRMELWVMKADGTDARQVTK